MILTYDQIQANAQLVTCVMCQRVYLSTHPTVPYTCVACRQLVNQ